VQQGNAAHDRPAHPGLVGHVHEAGHDLLLVGLVLEPVDLGSLVDELQRCLDPETVGRIKGITLFGFLQLLEVERKTAVVVVHGSGTPGRFYFDDGKLVHAHTRRLNGLEAVYEILGWSDPTVEIFYKRRPRERTVREPLQHVLMEAARLLDERRRAAPVPAANPPEVPVTDARPAYAELEHLAGALPPTERAAVVLRYGYDLSYDDIGAALGSSAEAARQAASTGVRRLRGRKP